MRPTILAMVVLVAACGGGTAAATPAATSTAVETPAPVCTKAPKWLKAAIQGGITKKGAKLTDTFIAEASNYLSGPPIVLSDKFASSWWVGGRINGGGVEDEVATWITNSLDEGDPGLIFAASAAARRYSDWGAEVTDQILGDGEDEVRTCVG